MRFFKTLIFPIQLFCLSLLVSGCATRQQQLLFKQTLPIEDSTRSAASGQGTSDYRIKSQDLLRLRNLQSTKYIVDEAPATTAMASATASEGQTYQVEDDGTVALPVIGHVHVAGLTRSEAAKLIEDLYRKNLLKDPIIELKIVNLKVTVLGEVKGQGNYPLIKDKTNLIEMIGEAGGLTEKANEKNVKIIRGDPKNPVITEVDLSNTKSLADPRIILQNNDIIYVSQSKRAVKNDQLQNLSSTLSPIVIVLNTVLVVYTLIHR